MQNNARVDAIDLLPTVRQVTDTISFTFNRALFTGLTYEVQYSTDLDSWITAVDGINGVVIRERGGANVFSIPPALAGDRGQLYIRLMVTE